MTPERALFVKLMEQYLGFAYRLTLLEVQKAYFLQEAGEPLRLRYEPGHYGPYATAAGPVGTDWEQLASLARRPWRQR
jgi:uncharacterized protein YwgA